MERDVMNNNEHTVVEAVKKKLGYIARQEVNVDKEIATVQKQIDNIPRLKARLEKLKTKKKQLNVKRQNELQDIKELAQLLPA